MTGLLDRYAARKRKWQEDAAREADVAPDQAVGSSRPAAGGSSEEQAIIIPGSPETGSNDRLDIRDDVLGRPFRHRLRFKRSFLLLKLGIGQAVPSLPVPG